MKRVSLTGPVRRRVGSAGASETEASQGEWQGSCLLVQSLRNQPLKCHHGAQTRPQGTVVSPGELLSQLRWHDTQEVVARAKAQCNRRDHADCGWCGSHHSPSVEATDLPGAVRASAQVSTRCPGTGMAVAVVVHLVVHSCSSSGCVIGGQVGRCWG